MTNLCKPRPALALFYVCNGRNADLVLLRDSGLGHMLNKIANLCYLGAVQLGALNRLPNRMCAVADLVASVFNPCLPTNVSGIAAFSITAFMRGLMFIRWGRSVHFSTYNPVHSRHSAMNADLRIPSSIEAKGPDEAIIALVLDDHITKEVYGFPFVASTFAKDRVRVAMSSFSLVVHAAHRAFRHRLEAIFYRAYRFVSHLDLLSGGAWLEPAAALQRSAGSSILDDRYASYNAGAV